MAGTVCFNSVSDHMVQFYCKTQETCCGSECCSDSGPFYIHWYFWLAVCMFLLVVLGFALSACRHFKKQHRYQQWCIRNKPELGADLLLNYHLMRTDVLSLPKYEDTMSTSFGQNHVITPPIITILPPPLPLPPSYSDCSSNTSSSSSKPSSGESNDEPPPAYSDCVMQV